MINQRIGKARRLARQTLCEVSRSTGIGIGKLIAFESGLETPNISQLITLANHYGVSLEYFFRQTEGNLGRAIICGSWGCKTVEPERI